MRAEKDAANRERQAAGYRQGSTVDARVASANLSRAFTQSRQDATEELGRMTIDKAKGSSSGVLEKLGSLSVAAGATAIALTMATGAAKAYSDFEHSRGDRNRSMGERIGELGKSAATLGMSQEQMLAFQKGGGKMTVEGQEKMLNSMARNQEAKPFGMPRAKPEEIMKLLAMSQETGVDLSGVVANPALAPGNAEILAKMELTKHGASLASLGDRRGNGAVGSASKAMPAVSAAELRVQSSESNIADAANKRQYVEGVANRAGADAREHMRGQSATGRFLANTADYTEWIPGIGGKFRSAEQDSLMKDPGNTGEHLRELQKQTALMAPKPPKPTVGRNGDQ